jgi:hypothetical protein
MCMKKHKASPEAAFTNFCAQLPYPRLNAKSGTSNERLHLNWALLRQDKLSRLSDPGFNVMAPTPRAYPLATFHNYPCKAKP